MSAFYVYERTGEPWLLDLARKLRAQGVDFEALYRTDDVTVPTPRRGLWKWTKHVVNTAMAAKAAALSWRLDQRPADRAFATRMLEILDRHHGQVTGMFTGDECLAGRNPLQGTELCSVVEFLYSLEHLFSVFGDPAFADRLERVAFNALPATFAPDMWSHQYDQQVNQVQCTVNPDHLWTTNGPESNLYGLEPNFGCCTANMHQGWPKFVAHLWMKTPDEGLVAAAWAPSEARLQLARRAGRRAPSTRTTPSARRSRSRYGRSAPARFPLVAARAGVGRGRDGDASPAGAEQPMRPGTLHRLEREWSGETGARRALPHAAPVTGPLQRGGGRRARPARLRAGHRGGVDAGQRRQAAPGAAARRLRGAPHDALELRPRARPRAARGDAALRGAAGRRAAVLAGGRGDERHGAGEAAAALDARARLGGRGLARRPAVGPRRARGSRTARSRRCASFPYGCTNIRITEFPRLDS